ncbi:MAG: hypothetical protein MJ002_06715 [Paludibacteraceae bacterium]|nr:hypothetical protein [Paludibacteraceae bacterium]
MDSEKFKDIYRVKSARYVLHKYNMGEYFITICTSNRRHYFGHIGRNKNFELEMSLSEIGRVVDDNIRNINLHHPYAHIPAYVIMPNHIHLVVIINDIGETEQAPSLQVMDTENIIFHYKKANYHVL